jgi:hypothetical protein
MPLGKKAGGRQAGTPNKATAEVRALASEYGEAALEELARLGNEAESEQARIAACKELLDRAFGRSRLGAPIEIELPDTSIPEGIIKAVSVILQAVACGKMLPADASDLCAVIESQRKAIELGDHEARLKQLEATRR